VIDDIKDLNLGAEKDFVLYQNYPNPFNPSTTIYYNVPSGGTIDLRVYDILGNEIVTLAHGNTTPGLHQASFNAGGYSSGSYFAVLKAGAQTRTIKMTVIK
jgi:hypothetical protein